MLCKALNKLEVATPLIPATILQSQCHALLLGKLQALSNPLIDTTHLLMKLH